MTPARENSTRQSSLPRLAAVIALASVITGAARLETPGMGLSTGGGGNKPILDALGDRRQARDGQGYDKLETSYDGSNGSHGVMFDVRSVKSTVQIKALAIHCRNIDEAYPVRLYAKDGSHRGFETNESAWTLIFEGNIECKGFQKRSDIKADQLSGAHSRGDRMEEGIDASCSALRVGPGDSCALYVHSDRMNIRYTNAIENDGSQEMTAKDGTIFIRAGTGMGGFFEYPNSPRHWNGVLYYTVEVDNTGNTNGGT